MNEKGLPITAVLSALGPRQPVDNGGRDAVKITGLEYGSYRFELSVAFEPHDRFWYYAAFKHDDEARAPLSTNAVRHYASMLEAQEAAIAAIIALVDLGSEE